MRGHTHILGGVLFAEAALLTTGHGTVGDTEAAFLTAAAFGALLPDIDHPGAKISKMNSATRMLSAGVSALTRHRGFTHTLVFTAIITLLSAITIYFHVPYCYSICSGLLIGMLSHMCLDSLNPTGIMWLYPFRKKRYHIAKIKTGSPAETWFFLGAAALAMILFKFSGAIPALANTIL